MVRLAICELLRSLLAWQMVRLRMEWMYGVRSSADFYQEIGLLVFSLQGSLSVVLSDTRNGRLVRQLALFSVVEYGVWPSHHFTST